MLIEVLQDPKQRDLWVAALSALGAIGPGAAAAKPAILLVFSSTSSLFLVEIARTLSQLDAKLDPQEFALLTGPYREACEPGFRDRVRDGCFELEQSLSRLARSAGVSFRAIASDR